MWWTLNKKITLEFQNSAAKTKIFEYKVFLAPMAFLVKISMAFCQPCCWEYFGESRKIENKTMQILFGLFKTMKGVK